MHSHRRMRYLSGGGEFVMVVQGYASPGILEKMVVYYFEEENDIINLDDICKNVFYYIYPY